MTALSGFFIYSDYDVRDRGHGDRGGRGHSSQSSRDAYRERRDRDPERNLSDQSRDTQQSSGSFNRSMSNTDITPDDKVGKHSEAFNQIYIYIYICNLQMEYNSIDSPI